MKKRRRLSIARPDTWMPIFWGDYDKDTGDLGALHHGAYLMLIKHYWCTGRPLPDDDDALWRVAKCDSIAQWRRQVRPRVERFFHIGEGAWRHKRVDAELAEANERVAEASEIGARAVAVREAKRSSSRHPSDDRTDQRSDHHSDGQGDIEPMNSSISKPPSQSQKLASWFNELVAVAGFDTARQPVHAGPITSMIAEGCDYERDILPTVRRIAERPGYSPPAAGFAYFRKPILEARDANRDVPTPLPRLSARQERLEAERLNQEAIERELARRATA